MPRQKYPEHTEHGYRVLELGKYIEAHQGRRFGKPTFKGTRDEVKYALFMLVDGKTVDEVSTLYGLPREAIQEAVYLAAEALTHHFSLPHPLDEVEGQSVDHEPVETVLMDVQPNGINPRANQGCLNSRRIC